MGFDRLPIGLDAIGALAQVNGISISLQQACPPATGLRFHQIHQLGTQHPIWKARKVLHVRSGHQLTTRNASTLETCDQQRVDWLVRRRSQRCIRRDQNPQSPDFRPPWLMRNDYDSKGGLA